MEIEEGVQVTEQVIQLLDQMIKQGKELRILEPDDHEENIVAEDIEFVGYGKIRSFLLPHSKSENKFMLVI